MGRAAMPGRVQITVYALFAASGLLALGSAASVLLKDTAPGIVLRLNPGSVAHAKGAKPEAPRVLIGEKAAHGAPEAKIGAEPDPQAIPEAGPRGAVPPANGQPRVAVILRGVGLSRAQTEAALALPPQVTLAFSPYGRALTAELGKARTQQREIFADLPADPGVDRDAGPRVLLAALPDAELTQRIALSLHQVREAAGVLIADAAPFSAAPAAGSAARLLASHGYVVAFDGGTGIEKAEAAMVRAAEAPALTATRAEIEAAFARAEQRAHETGGALVVLTLSPAALELVKAWTDSLASRGYALVPASALAEVPPS